MNNSYDVFRPHLKPYMDKEEKRKEQAGEKCGNIMHLVISWILSYAGVIAFFIIIIRNMTFTGSVRDWLEKFGIHMCISLNLQK